MSLNDFKPQFDNAYEEVFQKVLVGKKIANLRFEPVLKYGESVERVAYDISGVRVRSVTRGNASTIDSITDTSELLVINLEKEAVFHISDGEVKQAGPLNPGEVIGGQIAIKVAADLDARILYETKNAYQTFDTGDLTTLASTGVPITLSSTTVPQMVTRMPAKLRKGTHQTLSNMCMVVDSYALSDMEQFLLAKQFNIVESVWKNGYAGSISQAEVYVSENLTGEVTLGLATNPSNGDTLTINGVTITFVSSIGTTAGNVLIGANADATRASLAGLINNPGTTSATQVALSTANQNLFTDEYRFIATNDDTANTLNIVGIGSGRITVAKNLTASGDGWTTPYVHAYYGKKGGIDVVVQDMKEVDMRPTADRRGTNVFTSYLAGIKTFADGAKKFLDLKIAA